MNQTLQHRHQLRRLNESLKRADLQLLSENKHAQLLIEAMNDQDLQQASNVIDKLRGLKGKGIKSLDDAINKAESQINRYTAGGPLVKAWNKLKGIAGFDNPLVRFMTFANALEQGFRQLPTIIKNNLPDVDLNANQDETIAQLVTDVDKQKTITDNMLKALSPKGIFGAFKKVPYIDKNTLAQNLLNVPIKQLSAVIRQVNSGPNSDQIAGDIKDTATAGGPATIGTTGAAPAQKPTGTLGTTPGKPATGAQPSAPTGETPERTPVPTVDQVYKKLSTQLIDAAGNENRAKAVLKLLSDEGMLKA